MKRALAERAKHSSFETSTTTSTTPHKVPRLEQPPAAAAPTPTAPPSSAAAAAPPADESSAFYLKHQNRALATELQTLRHTVSLLEQEREARRHLCQTAARKLLSWWSNDDAIPPPDPKTLPIPPSTGTGDSVEWTRLLQFAMEHLPKQQKPQPLTNPTTMEELQIQINELSASRDALHQQERTIRRNVYRMSAGMLTPEQVVESLDKSDDSLEASVRLEKTETNDTIKTVSKPEDSEQVQELQSKLEVLEATLKRSEESIRTLNALVTEKEETITQLSQRQLTESDERNMEALERTKTQLALSESTIIALKERLDRRETEWAQALGNETTMKDSVDGLIQKFNKRWCELTGSEKSPDEATKLVEMANEDKLETALARKNADLQHRLNQAMENVRQADATRETLKSALLMNAALNTKLDEVKGKYAAVQAARGVGVKKSKETTEETKSNSTKSSSHSTKESSAKESSDGKTNGESGSENYEKLYMAYKKLKRDLAATMTSKETAKAKLERAERERESLMDTNIKLVRQIAEKEDMNAQSLSTILHLKNLTEKFKEERDLLEQEAKSASQLALTARLTSNAKAKVSDELLNEKRALLSRIQELEKVCTHLRTDLEAMSSQCSEASGKLALKDNELEKIFARSNDLAKENEEKREEVRKLNGQCEAAERETKRVRDQLAGAAAATEDGGESATFSVKQLQTQVHFLKNRLACPVCHYRDKECIIMRCRHMHCKACVDEQVSNRSRKCPTCNLKFSENDIQDVWLN